MAGGFRLTAGPGPWLALSALAAGGALVVLALPARLSPLLSPTLSPTLAQTLDWQPGLWPGQPWRLVTAAWVHFSHLHLLANLAGTAVVAVLGVVAGCGPRAALAWALAWPLTHAGLALQPWLTAAAPPPLTHYGGLSGVLHAAVAVVTVQLLLRDRGGRRAIGVALLAGLLLKLAFDAPGGPALRHGGGWDFAVVPLAHALGAAAGALCALLCLWPRRRRHPAH